MGEHRPERILARRGGFIEALRLPASLFSAVARARAALYSRGVLPSYDVGIPVVSVGNLSAGGTGKTPMIAWLARELIARGRKPGIVSRGYRTPDGATGENDEAKMLAELLPDVLHVQNRDRVAAARELSDKGLDVVLVADGFQHRRLARDLDLVLVDAMRPWGLPAADDHAEPVKAMLPRGLLREPVSALARADAIVVTRSDALNPARLDELRRELSAAAPDAPIELARHAPTKLTAFDGTAATLKDLDGASVDLFSGIGNPEAFEATVRSLGALVETHRAFGDHHAFEPADLAGLGTERPVVTTAKDAARIRLQPGLEAPSRTLVLEVELDIVGGGGALRALLDALPESPAERTRASIHEGLHG